MPRWYGAAAARALKRRRGAVGAGPPPPEVGPRPLGRGCLFLFLEMRSSRDMSRASAILPILPRGGGSSRGARTGRSGGGGGGGEGSGEKREEERQATRRRQATSFRWAEVSGRYSCGVLGPHDLNWADMDFSHYYPEPDSPARQPPLCRPSSGLFFLPPLLQFSFRPSFLLPQLRRPFGGGQISSKGRKQSTIRSDLIRHETLQAGIHLRSVALSTHLPLYFTRSNEFLMHAGGADERVQESAAMIANYPARIPVCEASLFLFFI